MENSSSEDKIINKRRKRTTNNSELAHLFDEPSSSSSSYDESPIDTHELDAFFGTGTEYIRTIQEDPILELVDQQIDVGSYAVEFIGRFGKEIVAGDNLFLIYLHKNPAILENTIFDVIDAHKRFLEYIKLTEMKISTKYKSYEECVSMHNYIKGDLSSHAKLIFNAMLKPEDLYENVNIGQRINEPIDPDIELHEFLDEGILEVADFYAKHPLFESSAIKCDTLEKYFLKEISHNFDATNSIKSVNNAFLSNWTESIKEELLCEIRSFDDLRTLILHLSLQKIKNLHSKQEYLALQSNKREYMNIIVDEILNRVVSGAHPLLDGEFGVGIFFKKGTYHCTLIDYKGRSIDYYARRDYDSIKTRFEGRNVVFHAIGSYERNMLFAATQIPDVIITDLELVHCLYDPEDPRAFSLGIARRVAQIEVEYIRALKNKVTLSHPKLTREESNDAFEIGVRLALALTGVNINKLLFNEYSHVLHFIGLNDEFVTQLNAYGQVTNVESLKKSGILQQCFDQYPKAVVNKNSFKVARNFVNIIERQDDFDNACVFIRGNDYWGKAPIHPLNYGRARILCSAATEEDEENDAAIKKVLEDPSKLMIDMGDIIETNPQISWIKECLINHRRVNFTSAPDNIIHDEINGRITGKVEGRILKTNNYYYFVECEVKSSRNSAIRDLGAQVVLAPLFLRSRSMLSYFTPHTTITDSYKIEVSVKKGDITYYENQDVTVEVLQPLVSTLSFEGRILQQYKQKRFRFIDHPFFVNMTCTEAENYLSANNKTLLLRLSSKGTHGIVTMRIKTSLNDFNYQHIKFDESKMYTINDTLFEDLDEMLTFIGRSVKLYDEIRKRKDYNEDEMNAKKGDIVLPRKYPGKVAISRGNQQFDYLTVWGNKLRLNNNKLVTIEEFNTLKGGK